MKKVDQTKQQHSHNQWQKNVRLLFMIRASFSMLFIASVITLFWGKYGLDLFAIFKLQAIFAVSIVLLEVPTGYLADRLGRRVTLQLSTAVAAVGWVLYAISNHFWHFVVMEVVLGAAFSLLSGTDSAFLYESLKEQGKESTFTKVGGRLSAIEHWGEGISAMIGGILALYVSFEWLILGSGVASLVGFVLTFFLKEPHREGYEHPRGALYGLYKIGRFVFLRSKMVRYVVPLMAFCLLGTMLGVWLYQPLWKARQIPVWMFGFLWAAISLVAGVASHFAHALEDRLGQRAMLWLLPLPVLLGYLLTAIVPGALAVLFVYFVSFLRGLTMPILAKYIHEETFSDKRATVLSLANWLFRFIYFFVGPAIGWIAQKYSLNSALVVCALIATVTITLFVFPVAARVDKK